jgi:UDP-N-acetylmuramoyl-L-alanyl-D-glutamate--2,6-diaminopimelate ligase
VLTFARGADSGADLRTLREEVRLTDATLVVETPRGGGEVQLPLPGDFQIENALAAAGATLALGVPWEQIRQGLASCEPVPGRLEPVGSDGPFVFVDYAHTPDALDAVLSRIRGLVGERLICVFGCGGDRDRTKRAPMARAACRHSDYVIATSDNPRTEDPAAILDDVREGLSGPHEVIEERGEAIRLAIERARPQDVVLIAGKGHEDYQIIGEQRIDFDDRVEARRALAERGERT